MWEVEEKKTTGRKKTVNEGRRFEKKTEEGKN